MLWGFSTKIGFNYIFLLCFIVYQNSIDFVKKFLEPYNKIAGKPAILFLIIVKAINNLINNLM
ncbi:MAG: hypothetical protein A3G39_07785 [Deltaproteobacteria bacterium RIFCSPLOWO2_12_FULL_43_16]|nr:MAG: hypothetical protein A3D30_07190 [Deltaproteobacteria bacterium RIFCSPHIGHO2_02_FULL_43_33]OGQ61520.1 MAG: hypothetical protein A3G39_07785 [Deltaproteobacteria bacterium RIFCSPLOWO2_12_FULL_43_16]